MSGSLNGSASPTLERDADQCVDVAEFLRILHPPGAVFEVRAPNCPDRAGGTYRATASGYFNDPDVAASEIAKLERLKPQGIYVSLNPVDPNLLARSANAIDRRARVTAADDAVHDLLHLMVDIDPVRPAGISSTDDEMDAALRLAQGIRKSLSSEGWPPPLIECMSGNGATLIYAIRLPTTAENVTLIRHALEAMAGRFNDERGVEVDTSVHNPSRITKAIGTVARKGSDLRGVSGLEDRPHRRSWFRKPDGPIDTVSRELLEQLAAERPGAVEDGLEEHRSGAAFTMDEFIAKHNLQVTEARGWGNGRKWEFKGRSPICGDHADDRAAFLIEFANGVKVHGCLHARCRHHKWQDLRQHLEPGCYDDRDDADDLVTQPAKSPAPQAQPPRVSSAGTKPVSEADFRMRIRMSDPPEYELNYGPWGDRWLTLQSNQVRSFSAVDRVAIETLYRAMPDKVRKRWSKMAAALLETADRLPADIDNHTPAILSGSIVRALQRTDDRRHGSYAEWAASGAHSDISRATGTRMFSDGTAVASLDILIGYMKDGERIAEATRKRLSKLLRDVGGKVEIPDLTDGRRRVWKLGKSSIGKIRALATGDGGPSDG